MSEENVEVVLNAVDAVNRRDPEAFIACLHPDVEWRVESSDPLPGLRRIYRGQAEVREWFEEVVLELWGGLHIEVEETTEVDGGRVFLGLLVTARGGASGAETTVRSWQLFRVVNGKAVSREVFSTRAAAVEAAGLSE